MLKIPPETIIKWKPASILPKNSELQKGSYYYSRYYLVLADYEYVGKSEDLYGPFHIEPEKLTLMISRFERPICRRPDKKLYAGYWSIEDISVTVRYYAEMPIFLKTDYNTHF